MTCPTCTAKMRTVGTGNGNRPINYCDRCGTLTLGGQHRDIYTPALVERARELCRGLDGNPDFGTAPIVCALREAATGRAEA